MRQDLITLPNHTNDMEELVRRVRELELENTELRNSESNVARRLVQGAQHAQILTLRQMLGFLNFNNPSFTRFAQFIYSTTSPAPSSSPIPIPPPPPPMLLITDGKSNKLSKAQIKKEKEQKEKNDLAEEILKFFMTLDERTKLKSDHPEEEILRAKVENKQLAITFSGKEWQEEEVLKTMKERFALRIEEKKADLLHKLVNEILDKIEKNRMVTKLERDNKPQLDLINEAIEQVRKKKKAIFEDAASREQLYASSNPILDRLDILKSEVRDFMSMEENSKAKYEMGNFTKANVKDVISFIDKGRKQLTTDSLELDAKTKFENARIEKICANELKRTRESASKLGEIILMSTVKKAIEPPSVASISSSSSAADIPVIPIPTPVEVKPIVNTDAVQKSSGWFGWLRWGKYSDKSKNQEVSK